LEGKKGKERKGKEGSVEWGKKEEEGEWK